MELFDLIKARQGQGQSDNSRFWEALGKDKMGQGSRYSDTGFQYSQAPVAQQQNVQAMLQGMPTGQQGQKQIPTQQLDQFLVMLMGGAQ